MRDGVQTKWHLKTSTLRHAKPERRPDTGPPPHPAQRHRRPQAAEPKRKRRLSAGTRVPTRPEQIDLVFLFFPSSMASNLKVVIKTDPKPETNSALSLKAPSNDSHEDIGSQSPGIGPRSHGHGLGPPGHGCGGHRHRLVRLLCEQVCHHIWLVQGHDQEHVQEHHDDREKARPLLQSQLQRVHQGPLQRLHRVQDLWGEWPNFSSS